MEEVIKGWTATTEYVYGEDLTWKAGEGENMMPDIYHTKRAVQEEIADDIIIMLRQFIDGEREWDEIQWEPDSYPVYIEIEKGQITCWEDESKKKVLYKNQLEYWREIQ